MNWLGYSWSAADNGRPEGEEHANLVEGGDGEGRGLHLGLQAGLYKIPYPPPGVYILQNTMVVGGGNGGWGKKLKLRVQGKKMKKKGKGEKEKNGFKTA